MTFAEIEKTFVINLPYRFDRLFLLEKDLKRHSISFEKIIAHDGENLKTPSMTSGQAGCLLSHFFVLKLAQYQNLKTICILEDDATFAKDFHKQFEKLEIPDFDILYLGGNTLADKEKPFPINERIYNANHGVRATHAMIIRNIPKLLQTIDLVNEIDINYKESNLNSYLVHPPLVTQRTGYSDAVKSLMSYENCQEIL